MGNNMSIPIDTIYDMISSIRVKASEDDLNVDEALDELEKEIEEYEYDDCI